MNEALPARKASVASDAAVALAGQILAYGLGFVASILIARALGPAGRGLYFLPVAAAITVVTVASAGLDTSNAIQYAQRRFALAQLARNAGLTAAIVSPLAVGALVGSYLAARDSVFKGVRLGDVLIVAATLPLALHALWLAGVLVLARRIARVQRALAASAVVQLAGISALYALGELGVTEALVIYAIAALVNWLGLATSSREVGPLRPSRDLTAMRTIAALGLRFHLGLMFLYLVLRIDVFLIGGYLGAEQVGIYSLAVIFAELVWLITNPLVQAALPSQAEADARDSAAFSFKAARFNFAIGLGLAALLSATLWLVIPAVYGEPFSDAYVATVLLLPGVVAMAAARPLSLPIARQERPWAYSGLCFGALATNVALNVALLPAVGVAGASIASSVTYAALALVFVTWTLKIGELRFGEAVLPQPGDAETLRRLAGRLREKWRGAQAR